MKNNYQYRFLGLIFALIFCISCGDNRSKEQKAYDESMENFDKKLNAIVSKGKSDLEKAERGVPAETYQVCEENSRGQTICITKYGYPD